MIAILAMRQLMESAKKRDVPTTRFWTRKPTPASAPQAPTIREEFASPVMTKTVSSAPSVSAPSAWNSTTLTGKPAKHASPTVRPARARLPAKSANVVTQLVKMETVFPTAMEKASQYPKMATFSSVFLGARRAK